jgi:hypothetical protein
MLMFALSCLKPVPKKCCLFHFYSFADVGYMACQAQAVHLSNSSKYLVSNSSK